MWTVGFKTLNPLHSNTVHAHRTVYMFCTMCTYLYCKNKMRKRREEEEEELCDINIQDICLWKVNFMYITLGIMYAMPGATHHGRWGEGCKTICFNNYIPSPLHHHIFSNPPPLYKKIILGLPLIYLYPEGGEWEVQ